MQWARPIGNRSGRGVIISPELGHVALIIALCLALLQSSIPLVGSYLGVQRWMRLAHSLAIGHLVFVGIAFGCLVTAFMLDDFSLRYVVDNSNRSLPTHFKFSAVWSAHEGSLLLWALVLAAWGAAVAIFSRSLPLVFSARALSVLAMIAVGFGLFMLLTSNPFERTLPFPPENGSDLNPLLQDIGLIIHPPMLYMGYVGLSVPFAFAIAALLGGQFDSAWARWCRPWINVAWVFLTLGITLGSWWAYYELGWGGWWFWDPVENASFMPWLVATALMHSVAATEKRGVFRSWTLLLAIFAFSLSLLGTFLVRSGVLTSVHAFASDPERGLFILIFLSLVIGASLLLFALRGPAINSKSAYTGAAREVMILTNNLILVAAMAMILIGTLYPLVADALQLGKISVGPPYFNFFFVPLSLVLMACLGIAASSRWRHTAVDGVAIRALIPMVLSLLLGALLPIPLGIWFSAAEYSIIAALTLAAVFWVVIMSLQDVRLKAQSVPLTRLPAGYWGMLCAHCGLALCALGVGLSSAYDSQRDMRMELGDVVEVAGYTFEFSGLNETQESNYRATRGLIAVSQGGRPIATLTPEKRHYQSGGQVMTEAAIDAGLTRDLFVALGEPLSGNSWAIRVQVKPFVRCIWLGGLMMGIGGLIAVADKRYRRRKKIPSMKRNRLVEPALEVSK
jgi:cytochrome c-type biogenesis protein CcmF